MTKEIKYGAEDLQDEGYVCCKQVRVWWERGPQGRS